MFGGLRPEQMAPINRGCVNTVVYVAVKQDDCDSPEEQIDKTNKRLWITAKTKPWDTVGNDSDAVFKEEGTIPDPVNEPGRVVFTLTEEDTYKDPTIPYFCDIVETDLDGTSNANRLFIGTFWIVPGPNNAQAGGNDE
jgi:hypothetical protein